MISLNLSGPNTNPVLKPDPISKKRIRIKFFLKGRSGFWLIFAAESDPDPINLMPCLMSNSCVSSIYWPDPDHDPREKPDSYSVCLWLDSNHENQHLFLSLSMLNGLFPSDSNKISEFDWNTWKIKKNYDKVYYSLKGK